VPLYLYPKGGSYPNGPQVFIRHGVRYDQPEWSWPSPLNGYDIHQNSGGGWMSINANNIALGAGAAQGGAAAHVCMLANTLLSWTGSTTTPIDDGSTSTYLIVGRRAAGDLRLGAVPANCQRVRYWDKAGADEGKGDYTVGVLMAKDSEGFFYVEDVQRGQWTAFPRNQKIKSVAESDREKYGRVAIYIEQPPGLAKESTDTVIRLLAGFNVTADPVNKDKVERAEPFKAQCEAGNVKLVKGDWKRKYLEELTAFPKGKHDDQVDASSGAFNKLARKGTWQVA